MNRPSSKPAKTAGPVQRPGAHPVVLTIAGFDPSSGAGATADLKVFAAHGFYGMACLTALTIQSTLGVRRIEPVAPKTVLDTLRCLREDVEFAGVKIGMLATAGNVEVVAEWLAESGVGRSRVVLDPVLRASSGGELLEPTGVARLKARLLAQVGWITPNRRELEVLTGSTVKSRAEVESAARKLQAIAGESGREGLHVVVTGGDSERPDDHLLPASGEGIWLRGERIETRSTHGTGCAFSSALLCRLVWEDDPPQAVRNAKDYVEAALRGAYPVGRGKGPMNHFAKV